MTGHAPMADAALALAAHGWSVIPVHTVADGRCSCRRRACPSPGKHPRIRWERAMTRAATPGEIAASWQRWPDANVGVVTGWVSGVVVVDIDPRNGGDDALAELEAEHGKLPDTVTGLTGGGGRHLWFAHPPHLVPSRPLARGIDLKAEGGLVVAPPSRHVSGDRYRWRARRAPGDRLFAAMPDWVDRLSVAVDPRVGVDRPIANGDRHPVNRTAAERATFAGLWADADIEVGPDETMVRCPFHDDHRPSLHIDPAGCRWFCFGCRRGGGIQALRRLVRPETVRTRRARDDLSIGNPTLAPDVAVDVVGESRHQEELLALTGGRRTWSGAQRHVLARLEPVHDNPFDPEAVAVVIDGHIVGHLPRGAARVYRPVAIKTIDDIGAATCLAEIRGGWERAHGDIGLFGVVLSLPRTTDEGPNTT